MAVIRMSDLDLKNKRVLIREDLNVPIKDGKVSDDTRIRAALLTLERALEAGARVMVMSHLGRPTEGEYAEQYSLQPVAERLSELLGRQVPLVRDWLDGVEVEPGKLVLLENVRFNVGEKKNDDALAQRMAALCDVFVMDAFGTAHRAQASTHGVAKFAPIACAGPLLAAELEALSRALENPNRPMAAIVGGAKVSTKLTVLASLLKVVDQLIVGGGIANTFIAAAGHPVGKSLYEPELVAEARRLIAAAQEKGSEIPIPTDVVCAKRFAEDAEAEVKPVDQVAEDDMIRHVGRDTGRRAAGMMAKAGTIVWTGPVGVSEIDRFGEGTRGLGGAIAATPAFPIAGGGD